VNENGLEEDDLMRISTPFEMRRNSMNVKLQEPWKSGSLFEHDFPGCLEFGEDVLLNVKSEDLSIDQATVLLFRLKEPSSWMGYSDVDSF